MKIDGTFVPGQSVMLVSADGLAIVPSVKRGGNVIDLYVAGKSIASFPGLIDDWSINESPGNNLFYFTIYDLDETTTGTEVPATQMVVDAFGRVIASRQDKRDIDEEGGKRYAFTSDGSGLYRIPDEMNPTGKMEVLNTETLQASLSIDFGDKLKITDLAMTTSKDGFFIANDRLFVLRNGSILPSEISRSKFSARRISLDDRSGSLLVNGVREYILLDLQGREIYRQQFDSDAPITTSAKLAIDGSIGYYDPQLEQVVVRSKSSSYHHETKTPLTGQNWAQVECFTPRSAALTEGGNPKLLAF